MIDNGIDWDRYGDRFLSLAVVLAGMGLTGFVIHVIRKEQAKQIAQSK